MSNSIATGVYPVIKFFLPSIGESQANWSKYRDFLIAHWVHHKMHNITKKN